MKEVLYFYLSACPHCKNADKVMAEVRQNPKYANVSITPIEEGENAEFAAGFDYNYVPTFFVNGEKAYEAQPGTPFGVEECEKLFDLILSD